MSASPTRLVYQEHESLREHTSKVTNVQSFNDLPAEEQNLFKTGDDQTHVVELGETIFYVQGGGQPSDTGNISISRGSKEQIFSVKAVRYGIEGRVLHFGHFEPTDDPFTKAETVTLKIDGERRDIHSRVHTAGHLIGLAVRSLALTTPDLKDVTELKASHYPGACFVDFKGSIAGDHKAAIETNASAFVTSDLPIKIDWYAPDELKENGVITAEGMPIVAGDSGKVRVVDIVSAGPGGSRGAYPCGGTHVPETGKVGRVVVRNIKRQKGNSKVSYEVTDA